MEPGSYKIGAAWIGGIIAPIKEGKRFWGKPSSSSSRIRAIQRVVGSDEPRFPKRCGCGAVWTELTWPSLPLVGILDPDGEEPLELRTCRCRSTIAVRVADRETP